VLIGFVGCLRVSQSTLSFSKRATFIFVGVSYRFWYLGSGRIVFYAADNCA
jgi:hypothetical protein